MALIFRCKLCSSLSHPPWTSEVAMHVFLTEMTKAQEGTPNFISLFQALPKAVFHFPVHSPKAKE